jgi:DNA replicative helicase MCM subunit Mcm2 (Cdc46/Mcm family)
MGGLGEERWAAIRRAFTPSQPVQDLRLFAGRSGLLRRVIRAIEDQNLHVVVYGDRGIGKTSLMQMVRELAGRAHYVVSYTSCGEDSEFSDTMRAIAARIPLLYSEEFDPGVDEVAQGGTLADRLPAGTFTAAQLTETLSTVAGTRVLILLDEFDRPKSERFRNAVAELIKNLSDRSIRVQFLIGGVAANLSDLIAHVPSIRRNVIGIAVPNMDDGEVRDLIRIGTDVGQIMMSEAAINNVVTASAGLPYLASLIGQHAALHAAEVGATEIGTAHVKEAIARARDDIGSRLSPQAAYALSLPETTGKDSVIVDAATEAVREGGLIQSAPIIDRLQALSAGEKAQASLVEAVPDDPFGRWRFREDGVASYVWVGTQVS